MYAAESAQRLDGAVGIAFATQVHLHHFVTVHGTGIVEGNRQFQRFTAFQGIAFGLHLSIAEGCITQSVAEGEERLLLQVAVGTPLHIVILKVGQLGRVAIEGDGQPSAGVVAAEQCLGYGLSAGLSRVPCLQDGLAVARFWLQSDGRTRTVHQYDALAGPCQGGNQFPLYSRQLDVCAVASSESGQLHAHFLTLQRGGYAAYEYHDVGLFDSGHTAGNIHFLFESQVEVQLGISLQILKVQFNLYRFSCLYGLGIGALFSAVSVSELAYLFTVDAQAAAAVGIDFHLNLTRAVGHVGAAIGSREVGQVDAGGKHRGTRCAEAERSGNLVGGNRLAAALRVVPVGGMEAFALGRLATVEGTLRQGALYPRASGFVDEAVVAAQGPADAFQYGDGVEWGTVIVAPLHDAVVGIGPHDGYGQPSLFQRQDVVVVLQQYQRAACHLQRKVVVLLAGHGRIGDAGPRYFCRVIHFA